MTHHEDTSPEGMRPGMGRPFGVLEPHASPLRLARLGKHHQVNVEQKSWNGWRAGWAIALERVAGACVEPVQKLLIGKSVNAKQKLVVGRKFEIAPSW